MRRLKERFPNELVVIGVHSAKFPSERLTANIRAAVLSHDIDHPVVNDAGFKIWNSFNVHAWPTVVLIDPIGEVVGTQAGEIEAAEFIPVIEKMISQFESQGDLDRSPLGLQPEFVNEPRHALSFPSKVLVTSAGRLYVADTGHHRVLELSLDLSKQSARVERVFGSGQPAFVDGPITEAAFRHPRGMALVGNTLYVADTDNHAVRAIELEGEMVRTVAGTGEKGTGSKWQGHPTQIPLRSPWALLALEDATSEGEHVIFIAMAGTHQIWLLLGEDRIGVFAGNGREALVDGSPAEASFNQPSDLALGMGHLLVADSEASAIRAISLGENARVLTLVGQGLFEFGDVDGSGPEVRLQHPAGITFSEDSNTLHIADSYNHKIKRLDPATGKVETLIGTGQPGKSDGKFASASFYQPEGLAAFDRQLIIADTNNHLLRVADLDSALLYSLTIDGLEKLLLPPGRNAALGTEPVEQRLPEIHAAPGEVAFTFEVQLPRGYKINPGAPSQLRLVDHCNDQNSQGQTLDFDSGQAVTWTTGVSDPCELVLDLSVYYCETEDERLCLIHNRRLVLPVRVTSDGPQKVQVPLLIEQNGDYP